MCQSDKAAFMTPGSYCALILGFNVNSSTHNCGCVVDGGDTMAAI